MNKKRIGLYLKELRIKSKMSQLQLANKIGSTPKSIEEWENYGVLPSIDKLIKLSECFDKSLDDILECGKVLSKEDMYKKYPIFVSFYERNKYPPFNYYEQRILVNERLKELLLLARKNSLAKDNDFELRFLFENMCDFTEYSKNIKRSKDNYLTLLKIIKQLSESENTKKSFLFELFKFIQVKNNYLPTYLVPITDSDPKLFNTLEFWQKDIALALIQNDNIVSPSSYGEQFAEDYENVPLTCVTAIMEYHGQSMMLSYHPEQNLLSVILPAEFTADINEIEQNVIPDVIDQNPEEEPVEEY